MSEVAAESKNLTPEQQDKLKFALDEVQRLGEVYQSTKPEEKADLSFEYKETRTQTDQIRGDQVVNNAGGYVFEVSDKSKILRFLILGTTGGTYYSTEKELTMDNMMGLIKIIDNGDAHLILRTIYVVSTSGRNPKQGALMMAYALVSRYRVGFETTNTEYQEYLRAMHNAGFAMLNAVCRIPTHLFAFVKNCELIARATNGKGTNKSTGWGRQMRASIANWYYSQPPSKLAMQVTKYKKREGYTHRDLFRLSHPISSKHKCREGERLEVEQIYHYIVKDSLRPRKRSLNPQEFEAEEPLSKYSVLDLDQEKDSKCLDMIQTYINLNSETSVPEVVHAIKTHNLVREHIPTEHLNDQSVWHALLDKMPMTALIRNLGKLASISALDEEHVGKVVSMLTDESQLKAARIHPLNIILAKSVYSSGRGDKGSLTWEPNPLVENALEDAFYKAFINAPPTNKRICFAFDISGSMTSQISGTKLSCRAASAALSLVSLKNEKQVECVGFCHTLEELPYRGDWKIDQICNHMDTLQMGSTDCAQPMLWAAENNKKFDVFIVYTDCETYYGTVHPYEALRKYREASGITDARLIVMGMTATSFTIADPSDAGMLDIVGFDSAVPQLIHEFVCGEL
ncbi:unnamed protein product [Auanema sp. JU1783]|nr:unnamed protein product [Auanema sp. JU1783]